MWRVGILACALVISQGTAFPKDNQFYIDLVNSANTTWKAGHNFKNTSTDYLKMITMSHIDYDKIDLLVRVSSASDITNEDIPESFDASQKWPKCPHIKHVRDQGACGSCWAVSAASVMTDRLCIASNGSFRAPISAELLMTCCPQCAGNGDGCSGGKHMVAWVYMKTEGLVTGGDYHSHIGCQPYQIQPCDHAGAGNRPACSKLIPTTKTPKCVLKCLNPSYKKKTFANDRHKVKEAYVIIQDEQAIQREIMQRGPVAAQFDVYADFADYKSGVYHRMSDEYSGGHGVKVIGWGTDNGTPYWLVVNSWNVEWGDKGLFKIRRMTNGCGFENLITFGVV